MIESTFMVLMQESGRLLAEAKKQANQKPNKWSVQRFEEMQNLDSLIERVYVLYRAFEGEAKFKNQFLRNKMSQDLKDQMAVLESLIPKRNG